MSHRPRYLYVEEGTVLGATCFVDPRGMILVETPDGFWRPVKGVDLVDLHDRFPNFIRSTWRPAATEG
ncbi:MAG: hypothetical protein IT561_16465 [Alphaproteobacteria bacterium]|nr:hypothetical protein [Alphaproteobacteria bacterium]